MENQAATRAIDPTALNALRALEKFITSPCEPCYRVNAFLKSLGVNPDSPHIGMNPLRSRPPFVPERRRPGVFPSSQFRRKGEPAMLEALVKAGQRDAVVSVRDSLTQHDLVCAVLRIADAIGATEALKEHFKEN